MPDLLTHWASARIPGMFVRDRRILAFLIFGSFLPDLAAKLPRILVWTDREFLGPSHSLVGLLLICYAASLFVEERLRKPAFGALWAGGLLHLALDLTKDYVGIYSAGLLYPFSIRKFELRWIDPEDVVLLMPPAAAVLVLAAWIERRYRHVHQ